MNIADEVKIILDDHLVTHGKLKLNALSQSKHHAVTDYEKVYVKVLKPGTMSHASMLKTEVDFAFQTGYGTNPLMEQIIHRDSREHVMVMSAWEYEQQIPITYNLHPIQLAQAANELYRIHSFPKYEGLRENAEEEYSEYATCLTSHSFNFLSADHQSRIKSLYQHIVQPATESLLLNPQINVVCHGQATLDKIILKPSTVQWVDYEAVRSAPREYDASRMYLQLNHRFKRPDLWSVFRKQYESLLGRPLNDSLLEHFAFLHLGRKAMGLASTTLHTMNQEALLAFLQELMKLVSGKTELKDIDFPKLR